MGKITQLQIGKNGLSENFIATLRHSFEKTRNVKISVLKSARGEGKDGKQIVKKYSEEILKKLGLNYSARIVGFVINVRKLRRKI